MPAETTARATKSFRAWCLACLPEAFLQTKPCSPCASTRAPQWHLCGTQSQAKPQTYSDSHCFVVKPQPTRRYWHCLKPVSTMWRWSSQKRSQLCRGAQTGFHLSYVCQDIWTIPNRPEECQRPTTSQRDRIEMSHCRSRHNQQECQPGGRVCLSQTPKRQEVRAKTHVSPPGLHPSLGGWPEATVCPIGPSLWCPGWPILIVNHWIKAGQRRVSNWRCYYYFVLII